MAAFFIGLFSIFLVLVSLFLVLIILLQRTGSSAGMGTAMGGGAVDSALGVSTGNVLTKGTVYATVAFFVVAFGLYLGTLANANLSARDQGPALPELSLTDTPVSENEAIVAPAEAEEVNEMTLPVTSEPAAQVE